MTAPSVPTRPSKALRSTLLALAAAATFTACGGGDPAAIDAGIDAPVYVCGDGLVDPGEQCDDGNNTLDMVCDDRCRNTCGNGAVDDSVGEVCDPGIAAGQPGACPTDCNDQDGCTTDILAGTGCQAACMHSTITVPNPGDGCCPAGASSLTDSDCPVVCGNGVVENGERCDTAIAAGNPGACPVDCSDGFVCTVDAVANMGTCAAQCTNTQIMNAQNGDGCCPPGAMPETDTDCVPGCGNGRVDQGETCDTGIATGVGSCPTACTDGMVCTRDMIINGGTCTAACSFTNIVAPMNGDGCCPAGANSLNDTDCPPRCGNGLMEANEQCDDGNMNNADGCTNLCMLPPTAFRFADLDLRDPHVFVSFLSCQDVTDVPLAGFAVNPAIQDNITMDTDGSGFLDLSPTLVFRPLNQVGAGGLVEFHFATCTAPLASTSCRPGTQPPIVTQATNMAAGSCLMPLPGTVHTMPAPYTPAITTTGAPCFVTNPVSLTITLSGIPVPLRDARMAATYSGNPANVLLNGLLIGFITEQDANTTLLPATLPLIGGKPLSFLLPGGDPPGPDVNCATFSDKDTNNGVPGWWFYLNFPAQRVPWTGP
jgi:cysteine-rich repeat protein